MLLGMERDTMTRMLEEAAQNLSETERRIEAQKARIGRLEAAGRLIEARLARQTLAAITETRDALQLRLRVVRAMAASEIRFANGGASVPPDRFQT